MLSGKSLQYLPGTQLSELLQMGACDTAKAAATGSQCLAAICLTAKNLVAGGSHRCRAATTFGALVADVTLRLFGLDCSRILTTRPSRQLQLTAHNWGGRALIAVRRQSGECAILPGWVALCWLPQHLKYHSHQEPVSACHRYVQPCHVVIHGDSRRSVRIRRGSGLDNVVLLECHAIKDPATCASWQQNPWQQEHGNHWVMVTTMSLCW